jgi:hypothetical protein
MTIIVCAIDRMFVTNLVYKLSRKPIVLGTGQCLQLNPFPEQNALQQQLCMTLWNSCTKCCIIVAYLQIESKREEVKPYVSC